MIQLFSANYVTDPDSSSVAMYSNGDYVRWGADNDFPKYLLELVQNVGELNAIILQCHNYICAATPPNELSETINKLVLDYLIFGGFACKIVQSYDGTKKYLYYVDIKDFRTDETNTQAYIYKNDTWTRVKDTNVEKYLFYKGNNYRTTYPLPIWYSGLKSAEILKEIRTFNLSNIRNNFSSSGILSINGSTLSTQQMKELKKRIESTFCGANNAGKVLVVNDSNTDSKIDFVRVQPDNLANLYKSLQESAQNDLYIAFRINKMLLGENIMSGFSNQEFADAFTLFNNSVIVPIQKNISTFLASNGITYKFETTQIKFENHE